MAKWIHCPKCGHRMFFLREGTFQMEIKCTSCKDIITIDVRKDGCKMSYDGGAVK